MLGAPLLPATDLNPTLADEQFYPHRVIQADPSAVSPLSAAADAKYQDNFEYRFGLERLTVHDFATRFPLTGLMAARRGQVLYEHYFKGRDATMRLQSWSMAKSITSLLLGICIDRGLIASLDDPVELYAPALRDTFHGGISIRHLGNMASGAEILHASEDYGVLYPKCFTDVDSDISALVAGWNAQAKGRQGEPGGIFSKPRLLPLASCLLPRSLLTRLVFCRQITTSSALWRWGWPFVRSPACHSLSLQRTPCGSPWAPRLMRRGLR